MTKDEINRAIAEACGWTNIRPGRFALDWYGDNPDKFIGRTQVPNYHDSLDAMHEAEQVLTPEQEANYVEYLAGMIMDDAYREEPRYENSTLCSRDSVYRATSRQRAIAYVHVIGKWEGGGV